MTRVIAQATLVCLLLFGCIGCSESPQTDVLTPDGSSDEVLVPRPVRTPLSIQITRPVPTGLNPALVPPIFQIEWTANKVERVRWARVSVREHEDSWDAALDYLRNNSDAPEWSEWQKYRPHVGEGTSWRSPPVDFGKYLFAVQGWGGPGRVTDIVLGESAARLLVGPRATGPVLMVFNRYVGTIRTSTVNTPPAIVDIPSDVPMAFSFSADASSYGGIASGFRYGWDIVDPNDDSQWEMDFWPFKDLTVVEVDPRAFSAGTHTFHVEVIDDYGFPSRVTVAMRIVPFTGEWPLLVVDDWQESASSGFVRTNGGLPSDEENDAFWAAMTEGVENFDLDRDVLEIHPGQIPPLETLLRYRNIIWYTGGANPALASLIRWKDPLQPTGLLGPYYVGLYMAAGGHIMLCGRDVLSYVINPSSFSSSVPAFPFIFRYELRGDQDGGYMGDGNDVGNVGVGEYSFAYAECCVNVLDHTYIQNPHAVRRTPGQACPVNLIRDYGRRTEGLRACIPIDVTTGAGFPRLELRPEVSAPGKLFNVSLGGLPGEIYNPPYFAAMTPCGVVAEYGRGCFEPIYGLECLNTGAVTFGAPVAFWTSTFSESAPVPAPGGPPRSTVWGFDPVYFNPQQVSEAMDVVLFDEWQLSRASSASRTPQKPRAR